MDVNPYEPPRTVAEAQPVRSEVKFVARMMLTVCGFFAGYLVGDALFWRFAMFLFPLGMKADHMLNFNGLFAVLGAVLARIAVRPLFRWMGMVTG
jgi:hypothetical protein